MGGQDHLGRRHLVEVAHLQADDPVLDVVDDADTVAAADLGRLLEQVTSPSRSPSSATGRPSRTRPPRAAARRCLARVGHELEYVVRGGSPKSSIGPPSRSAPRGCRRSSTAGLGAALHRDPVLARVGDLLLAPHRPVAHGRDDLHVGRVRENGGVEPHLVVALAGAAVGDPSQPASRAFSTAIFAISGRPSAVKSG